MAIQKSAFQLKNETQHNYWKKRLIGKIRLIFLFILLSISILNCTKGKQYQEVNHFQQRKINMNETTDPTSISDESWAGKNITEVLSVLGKPDAIESAEFYSAKFSNDTPSVVLSYNALRKRWYITREGNVLGVIPFKE